MRRFLPLAQALGLNAIPLVGVFGIGWSSSTALALYWLENVFGALLVAKRIEIHRERTELAGHWRRHFKEDASEVDPTVRGGERTFLSEFRGTSTIFNLAHGFFLALLLFLFLPQADPTLRVDFRALIGGAAILAVLLLVGFWIDRPKIASWKFAEIRDLAKRSMGRTVLVHLTIIFGVFATAPLNQPRAFFAVFAALKVTTDLLRALAESRDPERANQVPSKPPRWALALLRKMKPAVSERELELDWQRRNEREARLAAQNETPISEFRSAQKGLR